MTVFLSRAVGAERIGFGSTEQVAGGVRSRFRMLADLYEASLRRCAITTAGVIRPEIYQTHIARTIVGVERGDWHLAVKPVEHLRPFHGLPNAFVCDGWPDGVDGSFHRALSDPLRMFEQADIVVCTTGASARALRAVGVDAVIELPPHVPAPVWADRRRAPDADAGTLRIGTWIDCDTLADGWDQLARILALTDDSQDGPRLIVSVPADALRADAPMILAERLGPHAAKRVMLTVQGEDGSNGLDWYDKADAVLAPEAEASLSVRLIQATLCGILPVRSLEGGAAASAMQASRMPLDRCRQLGEDAKAGAERRFGAEAFQNGLAELQRRLAEVVS